MNHLSLLPDDVQYLIYRHVYSGVMNELHSAWAEERELFAKSQREAWCPTPTVQLYKYLLLSIKK